MKDKSENLGQRIIPTPAEGTDDSRHGVRLLRIDIQPPPFDGEQGKHSICSCAKRPLCLIYVYIWTGAFHLPFSCARHYTMRLCSTELRVAGRTHRPGVTFSLSACEFQPTCGFPQNVNAAVTCGEHMNGQDKRRTAKQTHKQKKGLP